MTRLWERFSVDVGAARRRDAAFFDARVFERRQRDGYRVLIVEDGDRYAIRAACVFVVKAADGQVLELLHDRTVAGMSAASRLLGLAVREMAATGADRALAWSFAHSGSFPLFVRHAFLPARERTRRSVPELVVHAVSATSADLAAEGERAYVSLLDDPAA